MKMLTEANAPVGIFDSGIGGLSVLRHILAYLPHENVLYFADSGFAPYGGKPEDIIAARALGIAEFLMQHGAKALVIACNTATAAAITALRQCYPTLPIIGVEPGLKPAAALTRTGTVGVLATESTLASEKFNRLSAQIMAETGVRFLPRPCAGLADQVEKGELQSRETVVLLERHVLPLICQGVDTLVLGCTHYPFIQPLIEEIITYPGSTPITIVDTGKAIARQLARLLTQHGLVQMTGSKGTLQAFTTGNKTAFSMAFANLLALRPDIVPITL